MKNLTRLPYVFAILLLGSFGAFSQNSSRYLSAGGSAYVISAEAGGINSVEGDVGVMRSEGRSGRLLRGDSLSAGDVVETGADGRTEILLNPGSYVRLGSDSSFKFLDTSLENVELSLLSGSAILEVITSEDFVIAVNANDAAFEIIRSGVYRLDILADGSSRIEVWKGRAYVDGESRVRVKKGRAAVIDGDSVAVAKFDRGDRDELEEWSKERSKLLAKLNSRLERQRLRNSLLASYHRNIWNMYDSFGVWVYDPVWGAYCFLPFGSSWYSPYGYRYRRDIWYCRLPRFVNKRPARVPAVDNRPQRRDVAQGRSIKQRMEERRRDTTRRTPVYKTVERKEFPRVRQSQPILRSRPLVIPRSSNPQKKGDGN